MDIPVILCIGSSGVSGDSLGPLVGELLKEKYNIKAYVYGSLSKPVNGINYERYVDFIQEKHSASFIIAVDACVGERKDVGKVKLSAKGLSAGGALNKNLRRVGNIGILGVVSEKQNDNLMSLMSVPFLFVDEMSKTIAAKINNLITVWERVSAKIMK
ncbi:MAG: spore protease YyaC [Clostridia bacterium]|nr:spore protease YyaC [Clostridia bacterium]